MGVGKGGRAAGCAANHHSSVPFSLGRALAPLAISAIFSLRVDMARQTQQPSTLAAMADEMRKVISPFPRAWVHRTLGRGLHLVLERQETTWRLALGRTAIYPHETEAQICSRCFRVPEGTEWVQLEGQRKGYRVIECRWVEY